MRLVYLTLLALLSVSAFGASPKTVSLQGQVRADQGSSTAFVTVMATTADGELFITLTDVGGRYFFADLPPGKISIVASKLIPGIQQTTRLETTVTPGGTANLDIHLPGPVMNQCNCACPWDPHMQYNNDCSPCSPAACP